MTAARTVQRKSAEPDVRTLRRAHVEDMRFRTLLTPQQWELLPDAVRKRFSKRVSDGVTIVYKGRVTQIAYSRTGYVLAHILRIIGAPLPLPVEPGMETVVTVTEDRASGGQFWTRMFSRGSHFPQIIHSVKRFAGKTGLEEALPFGIVMALQLSVEDGSLCFRSSHYAWVVAGARVTVPAFLTPGALLVTHSEVDAETFRFTMTVRHPVLGVLLHQEAIYAEDRT